MRVAYFTSGTHGAGHIVRALAIERGLARAGFRGELRIFAPATPFRVGRPQDELVVVDTTAHAAPETARATPLAAALERCKPDLLLVDFFWAPLRFILPLAGCACWLLVRRCPGRWLRGPREAPFDPSQYERVIGIEPFTRSAVREWIDPVVICNPDECRPRGALRERLGVAPGRRLVVVTHAGLRGEVESLRAGAAERAADAHVAVLDLHAPDALFPAAEWLGDADEIVAAAGYNSFWEARWLGYDARTRFVAIERSIDDTARRLEKGPRHVMRENGADTLARWIVAGG